MMGKVTAEEEVAMPRPESSHRDFEFLKYRKEQVWWHWSLILRGKRPSGSL